MSVNEINSTRFNFSLLQSAKTGQSAGVTPGASDFLSSLMSRIADFKSQAVGSLISSTTNTDAASGIADFATLLGAGNVSGSSPGGLLANAGSANGLSVAGRNTALFDPESAYQMMTAINTKDVTYKAELNEMGDMKAELSTMQQEALKLGSIDATTVNTEIQSRLQTFADAYNDWIGRFADDLKTGGLLAGTQAATVSQVELEQSIENFFNGAKDGLHGMGDLGLTVNSVTNLASLDITKLNAVMSSNRAGVIGAIGEFSANFAKSAELLNSAGNFIPNRMDNLARAISYINENKQSLQAEFGTGAAASPSGAVARALASYNAIHGIAV